MKMQTNGIDRAADLDALVRRSRELYAVTTATSKPEPRHTFKCHRCNQSWMQERSTPPALCPHCGYARWAEVPESRTCRRCGAVWTVPQGHPHGKCPKCHSRLWNEPSKRKTRKTS